MTDTPNTPTRDASGTGLQSYRSTDVADRRFDPDVMPEDRFVYLDADVDSLLADLGQHSMKTAEMYRDMLAAKDAEIARLQGKVGWGRRRLDRLQQEQRRMRDPERTIVCDILANGTLLPDPNGTRYGKEEAMSERCKECGRPPCGSFRLDGDGCNDQWCIDAAPRKCHGGTMCHPAPQPVAEPTIRQLTDDELHAVAESMQMDFSRKGAEMGGTACQTPATPPASEASDLTKLIEQYSLFDPSVARDTIVLALRRDRVLTNDACFEVATTVGNQPRYRLRRDSILTGYLTLNEAERILGIGGD